MNSPATAAEIRLEGISKSFGEVEVISPLDAILEAAEFTVVLGPSGCGKSTLLNMIAGLEAVDRGRIWIGGREVQNLEPKDRNCAMVFQNYALYPHMTVADNIGYALKIARVPKTERLRRIAGAAQFVSLEGLLDRRPGQLSGGQRQRVAIARAIIREPKVMLFDEPLSNLDAKLRQDMRMELADLHRRIGATTIFVTHDQVEAMTLANRIMVLNEGRIEQFDTPSVIYRHPATTFVAGFIGAPPMNLIKVTGSGGNLQISNGDKFAEGPVEGPVLAGIRPEQVVLDAGGMPVRALFHEDLGSHRVILAKLPDSQRIHIATTIGNPETFNGEMRVRFPFDRLQFFEPDTGKALGTSRASA